MDQIKVCIRNIEKLVQEIFFRTGDHDEKDENKKSNETKTNYAIYAAAVVGGLVLGIIITLSLIAGLVH